MTILRKRLHYTFATTVWVVLHVMAWALLPNARPPYNQSVFRNHAVVCREEKSGRVESVGGARGGTCAADTSWRYAWREKGETAQPALTGKELCQLLPDGAQVLSMGDSISEQLLSSWRARLFTAGINHPQRAMARSTVCKDAPLTRFYHVEVWAWVLEGSAQFESSDSRTEDCAAELRRQPSAFGLKVVSRAALREIVANATEVVFSTFDHLSPVLDAVEACYSKQLGVAARRSAARDVLRGIGRVRSPTSQRRSRGRPCVGSGTGRRRPGANAGCGRRPASTKRKPPLSALRARRRTVTAARSCRRALMWLPLRTARASSTGMSSSLR